MKKYNLSVAWLLQVLLLFSVPLHAATNDCTQPAGKSKMFVKCGSAIVQADIPLEVIKSLSSSYPNSKILSDDLERDGVKEYVVYTTERTQLGSVDRIIILKDKAYGAYELVGRSSDIEYGKGNIELRNGSIFLSIDSSSLEESHNETFQFQFREHEYLLIGEEEISYTPGNGVPLEESRTSTNYLSRIAITTEKSKGVVTRVTKKVVDRKLISLENFKR